MINKVSLSKSFISSKAFAAPVSITPVAIEAVLVNEVTVYKMFEIVAKLAAMVEEFAEIWHNWEGFVDLSEEDWMYIPLRTDWKSKITGKPKVYPLNIKNRAIVDKVFNKLQIQDRLKYTKQSISFYFSIFIIYKILPDDIDHDYSVVDIRKFN